MQEQQLSKEEIQLRQLLELHQALAAWCLTYRGYSKLRTVTVLGFYGRSIRTLLRAVRVLTFE